MNEVYGQVFPPPFVTNGLGFWGTQTGEELCCRKDFAEECGCGN